MDAKSLKNGGNASLQSLGSSPDKRHSSVDRTSASVDGLGSRTTRKLSKLIPGRKRRTSTATNYENPFTPEVDEDQDQLSLSGIATLDLDRTASGSLMTDDTDEDELKYVYFGSFFRFLALHHAIHYSHTLPVCLIGF
jgi:hypothetical protein